MIVYLLLDSDITFATIVNNCLIIHFFLNILLFSCIQLCIKIVYWIQNLRIALEKKSSLPWHLIFHIGVLCSIFDAYYKHICASYDQEFPTQRFACFILLPRVALGGLVKLYII